MKKSTVATLFSILCCFTALQSSQASQEKDLPDSTMLLSRKGEALATIVTEPDAPEEVVRAAAELQKYLNLISGAEFTVVTPAQVKSGTLPLYIHVGVNSSLRKNDLPDFDACGSDGVWIKTLSPRDLLIAGQTPHGTEFGVYGFLEKFCGIRWYLPGPDGTHVPRKSELQLPALDFLDKPVFISRVFSGTTFDGRGHDFVCHEAQSMDSAWYRHNRMRRNLTAHHNLGRIIVPSKYGKKHPEYFPEIDGERKVPENDRPVGFQPCMSNDDVVRICAEAAARHFDNNPHSLSFDIGVNDHGGFCECAACTAINGPPRYNTRGLPEFSRLYLTFANRVAAALPERHKDRFLGVLAYAQVRDLPEDLEIHPNLAICRVGSFSINFNPADRLDLRTTLRFAEKCRMFSVYDYMYGNGYVIPNFGTGLLEEYLDLLTAAGTKGWYCEVYHNNWSMDGIKYRLLAQKLWNPELRVQDLLAEFCSDMFDDGAASMQRYFDICRERWEQQGFATSKYHLRGSGRQLVLFNETVCRELNDLLDEAEAATLNPGGRKLLASFRDTLAITTAYAKMLGDGMEVIDGGRIDLNSRAVHPDRISKASWAMQSSAEEERPVAAALRLLAGLSRVKEISDHLGRDAFTFPRTAFGRPGGLFNAPETIMAPFLMGNAEKETDSPEQADFVKLIADEVPQYAELAEWLLQNLPKMEEEPELISNGDFEIPAAHNAAGWTYSNWGSVRSSANAFLTPQGVGGGNCYYLCGLKSGFTYLPCPVVNLNKDVVIEGGNWYLLDFWIRSYRNDGIFPDLSVILSYKPGSVGSVSCRVPPGFRWYRAVRLFYAPQGATGGSLRLQLSGEGQAFVDKVSLKKVPAEYALPAPVQTEEAAVAPNLKLIEKEEDLPPPFRLNLEKSQSGIILRGDVVAGGESTSRVSTNDYIVAQVPWVFNHSDYDLEIRIKVSGDFSELMRLAVMKQYYDGREWKRTPGVEVLGRVKLREEKQACVFRYNFREPMRKVQFIVYRANQKGSLRLHSLELVPVFKEAQVSDDT